MKQLSILLLLFVSAFASAQVPAELKGQTITVIVPYGPGGGADTFNRMFANKVKQNTGLNIVVVNKAGAFATIGTREVAESKPDGLTLLGTDNSPIVFNPLVHQQGAVPRESFKAILVTVITPQGVYVKADSKYNTLNQLLEDIKKDPSKFTYGCAYQMCNLFLERLMHQINSTVVSIPYKSTPQVLMDLVNGQLSFVGTSSSDALGLTQGGKLKPIGFGTDNVVDIYPTVPLFKNSVPNFTATNFHGLYAPVDTPQYIVVYLNKVYREAMRDPEIQEQLRSRAVMAFDGSPDDAEKYITRQINNWKPIVEKFYKAPQ
jgi:tripartite-type tricarboxylate transporter receptor subunit TctC